jgi:hypothetical protein
MTKCVEEHPVRVGTQRKPEVCLEPRIEIIGNCMLEIFESAKPPKSPHVRQDGQLKLLDDVLVGLPNAMHKKSASHSKGARSKNFYTICNIVCSKQQNCVGFFRPDHSVDKPGLIVFDISAQKPMYDFFMAISGASWYEKFPSDKIAEDSRKTRAYFERKGLRTITDDIIVAYARKPI